MSHESAIGSKKKMLARKSYYDYWMFPVITETSGGE